MKSLEIVNNLINYMESVGETYDFTNISKKDCKKIKADLEVLEILRKHYKDIKVRPRLSNMKDLQKLKQWLEENENDR